MSVGNAILEAVFVAERCELVNPPNAGCATTVATEVARSCPISKLPSMFLPIVPTLEATLPPTSLPSLMVPLPILLETIDVGLPRC